MTAVGTTQTVLSVADEFPIPAEPARGRLEALDVLRGLLMILMALDHTRDYFGKYTFNPTDPQQSWPLLYLTRWVTHLCAPGFIALAGASIYLQRQRGKPVAALRRLVLTRGLWLLFLEVTIISFGWTFVFAPFLQVIWAIGWSMVLLSFLLRLPVYAIGAVGAAILTLHNLLDPIHAKNLGIWANLWKILHQPGMLLLPNGHPFAFDFYAVLPWFGVICVGYAFGTVAAAAAGKRRRTSLLLAGVFAAAFTALRLNNRYGDDIRFQHLAHPAQTLMSFFNVEKYPPSLEYVLATFTVLLLLYVLFDAFVNCDWLRPVRSFLQTFGRVPFFYYVPHIYLIHVSALLTTMALGGNWRFWIGTGFFTDGIPRGYGFSLPVIYAVWAAVVLALYLPCRWFASVKARRRDWWLSYL
jgi:uncharacterized membrane protein